METRKIKLTQIENNRGQIAGLPSNPRQWTKAEMENLKKSLQETPELFEARGIIVTPHEGKFVVLGGNMRFEAAKALGLNEAPCIVVPEGTGVEKLKEIVVKDNGSFGTWDYDMLANEWDDLPLTDWGVPAWSTPAEADEAFVDALFDGASEVGEGELSIKVDVPHEYEDKLNDIKESIRITIADWGGCKVK